MAVIIYSFRFSIFRPCELQISDFENAAVCCFVVLLTRSILSYKWNLLMPISLVDENMKRAQKRDAVLTQKFWWRKDIFTACEDTTQPEVTEMSIDEILNGIPGSDYQVKKFIIFGFLTPSIPGLDSSGERLPERPG